MILVALAMIAIIAMAALSIDVSTLYLAREEAQRSADASALAAARVISLSGITGLTDPDTDSSTWQKICGGASGTATLTAQAVAQQNSVAGIAATVSVLYSSGSGAGVTSNADCSTLATSFAVNPIVTVKITRTGLPTLFSRIWGNTGNSVSASATAEAFNPSNSGNVGNSTPTSITPVQPRCVKPWAVPNLDPRNPDGCTNNCTKFVDTASGAIQHAGISLGGSGTNGTIGETFWLNPDCRWSQSNCVMRINPPQANYNNGTIFMKGPPNFPNLVFAPAQIGTPVIGVPSCTKGDPYEEAIEGCDAPTNYLCGVQNANTLDLTRDPDGPTADGVSCLIHEGDPTDAQPDGQDQLNAYAAPSAYPFEIQAGTSNPLGISGGISKADSRALSASYSATAA